jgi:hypothetical protein
MRGHDLDAVMIKHVLDGGIQIAQDLQSGSFDSGVRLHLSPAFDATQEIAGMRPMTTGFRHPFQVWQCRGVVDGDVADRF